MLEGTEEARPVRFEKYQSFWKCAPRLWILLRILVHFRKKITSQILFGIVLRSFWHPQIENQTVFEAVATSGTSARIPEKQPI